mgnify:FL=1
MTKQRLSKKFWNPYLNELSPYTPGEQPTTGNYIKLNTNENPLGPSTHVKNAILKVLKTNGTELRLYPEPESQSLKKVISQHYKVNNNQIFVGNGSDEVLAFCFQALLANRGNLAIPEITYSFYPSLAKLFAININFIKLSNNFSFNLNNLNSNVSSVLFANPNATTGIALNKIQIQQFLTKNPQILVIVDEAYVDFGAQSCISLIKKYKNILITRTFSKSRGLAGMRLGFAVGNHDLIHALNLVKNSFNTYPVDKLASAAGIASLKDKKWFDSNKQKIIRNREFLTRKLKTIGFEVLPSQANFILASHLKVSGTKIFSELKKNKIIVRHFNNPKIKNWVRISIGTKVQCEKLLKVLKSIII